MAAHPGCAAWSGDGRWTRRFPSTVSRQNDNTSGPESTSPESAQHLRGLTAGWLKDSSGAESRGVEDGGRSVNRLADQISCECPARSVRGGQVRRPSRPNRCSKPRAGRWVAATERWGLASSLARGMVGGSSVLDFRPSVARVRALQRRVGRSQRHSRRTMARASRAARRTSTRTASNAPARRGILVRGREAMQMSFLPNRISCRSYETIPARVRGCKRFSDSPLLQRAGPNPNDGRSGRARVGPTASRDRSVPTNYAIGRTTSIPGCRIFSAEVGPPRPGP